MDAENLRNLLNQMDVETKRALAFILLREVLECKRTELEGQIEALKREEEKLTECLSLIEKKRQQFMPEYERLTKILNALDYASENISDKLKRVRDQLKIAEDKFNRYITRLERALGNA